MFPDHLRPVEATALPPFGFPVLKFGRSKFPKVMFALSLDTLSLAPYGAIAAITISSFNLGGVIDTRTILLDYDHQADNFQRHVDTSALRFWLDDQSAARRFILTDIVGDRLLADDAFAVLADFISDQKSKVRETRTLVWTKGIKFEAPILETLAKDYGTECPITYQEWADLRTLAVLTDISIGRFDGKDGAALTAPEQALKVIEALEKLNLS